MIFKVKIRNNTTSEIREIEQEFEDIALAEYMYSDGSYSCDCNRRKFFERVNGVELDESNCSDNLFDVQLLLENGKEIYSDFK